MQSLQDDGIFTSGDEEMEKNIGDALFDPSLPLEGEEEDLGAPETSEEETEEEF